MIIGKYIFVKYLFVQNCVEPVAIFNIQQHKEKWPQIKSNIINATWFLSPSLPPNSTWRKLSGGLFPSSHLRGHIHNNKKNVTRALRGDSARRQQAKWEIVWKIIPRYVQSVKRGQRGCRLSWDRNGAYLSHYSADLQLPVQRGLSQLCGCLQQSKWSAGKRQRVPLYVCLSVFSAKKIKGLHWNYRFFYLNIFFYCLQCCYAMVEFWKNAHMQLKSLFCTFLISLKIFLSMFKDFSTFLIKLLKAFVLCSIPTLCDCAVPLCSCSIICSHWFCTKKSFSAQSDWYQRAWTLVALTYG